MEQEGQEVYELTDLDVESVGLVFRGANRKPFYVVKSESQEVEMSDQDQDFSAIIEELEQAEEVNQSAWGKLLGVVKSALAPPPEPEKEEAAEVFADLSDAEKKKVTDFMKAMGKEKLGDRVWSILEKLAGEQQGYGYPEKSSEDEAEGFAQAIQAAKREVAEQFAAELSQEREARQKVEEAFAQEQRKRRLVEFGQLVAEQFTSLPDTGEQFAADLMAIHDADVEVYGRVSAVLQAANEAISKGDLFSQFSVGGSEAGTGDPFENAVEAIRKERFSDEDVNTGWAKALDLAMAERPELAAAYARKH